MGMSILFIELDRDLNADAVSNYLMLVLCRIIVLRDDCFLLTPSKCWYWRVGKCRPGMSKQRKKKAVRQTL